MYIGVYSMCNVVRMSLHSHTSKASLAHKANNLFKEISRYVHSLLFTTTSKLMEVENPSEKT